MAAVVLTDSADPQYHRTVEHSRLCFPMQRSGLNSTDHIKMY